MSTQGDWLDTEADELVRRLRAMSWPRPRPALRRRCLDQIQRRVAEMRLQEPGTGSERRELYEFTLRRPRGLAT